MEKYHIFFLYHFPHHNKSVDWDAKRKKEEVARAVEILADRHQVR
jgi:hypothetical protein